VTGPPLNHERGVLDTSTVIILSRIEDPASLPARSHDLPVYTCNPADFSGIDGLTVVAIPVPSARAT
jgi:hypothetical protein